jgi:hypothetical protein
MIPPQSPALQVLIATEAVERADASFSIYFKLSKKFYL